MKLNYRDKVILGVVLALLIAIAGFVGLIKPKNEEIKEDEALLVTKQEEQADLEARIARIEPLKNSINETYEETDKLIQDFIPLEEIDTPMEVDQYMQHFAEECGIRIDNLEITANKEEALDYYYLESDGMPSQNMRNLADLNGEYAEQDSEFFAESNALSQRNVENVIQAQYAVRLTGTREALCDYLKAIEDLKKTIIVNQVRIEDYSFGANALEAEGGTPQPTTTAPEEEETTPETPDENAEQPETDTENTPEENADQPEADTETTPDENSDTEAEVPAPAQAPAQLTIDDANTLSVQLIISLYSVYDMPEPNTEE